MQHQTGPFESFIAALDAGLNAPGQCGDLAAIAQATPDMRSWFHTLARRLVETQEALWPAAQPGDAGTGRIGGFDASLLVMPARASRQAGGDDRQLCDPDDIGYAFSFTTPHVQATPPQNTTRRSLQVMRRKGAISLQQIDYSATAHAQAMNAPIACNSEEGAKLATASWLAARVHDPHVCEAARGRLVSILRHLGPALSL